VQRGSQCQGYANIRPLFRNAGHQHGDQGALLNEKTGNSAAKGVGAGSEGQRPLEFNKKYNIGTLRTRKPVTSPCLSMRASINMRRLPVPVKWSRT
jgi:hypothetical protein